MKISINAGQFARALKPAIAVATYKTAVIPKEIALQFKLDKVLVVACCKVTAMRHHISDIN